MDKESSYNLRLSVNGIVIYLLLIYFSTKGKIKDSNLKITFTVLGFWFAYQAIRYIINKFFNKKERPFKMEYIVGGVSLLNALLYILGALGKLFNFF